MGWGTSGGAGGAGLPAMDEGQILVGVAVGTEPVAVTPQGAVRNIDSDGRNKLIQPILINAYWEKMAAAPGTGAPWMIIACNEPAGSGGNSYFVSISSGDEVGKDGWEISLVGTTLTCVWYGGNGSQTINGLAAAIAEAFPNQEFVCYAIANGAGPWGGMSTTGPEAFQYGGWPVTTTRIPDGSIDADAMANQVLLASKSQFGIPVKPAETDPSNIAGNPGEVSVYEDNFYFGNAAYNTRRVLKASDGYTGDIALAEGTITVVDGQITGWTPA